MHDTLADGRRFRTLNVLDIVTRETRECLEIEVDISLPGQRVTRVLDQLVATCGAPKQITIDNGPEFAGQLLDAWAYAHGVTLDFIEPGTPTQSGSLESFNGKFRDECLNVHGLRQFGAGQGDHPDLEGGGPPRATAECLTASGSGGLRSHISHRTAFLRIPGLKPGFRSRPQTRQPRPACILREATLLGHEREDSNGDGCITAQ
jgi:transposase InsO family protein